MIFTKSSVRMRRSLLLLVAGLLLNLPSPCEAGPSPTATKCVGMIRNDTVWQDGEPTLKWYKTWRIDTATGRHYAEDHVLSSKMK